MKLLKRLSWKDKKNQIQQDEQERKDKEVPDMDKD